MSEILNPYYLQIVMFFIINAIMGISIFFTLSTGQLTLGAAGFMSVGAYVGALLTLKAELPIPIAIFIGGIVAALVAVVILECMVSVSHLIYDRFFPLILLSKYHLGEPPSE